MTRPTIPEFVSVHTDPNRPGLATVLLNRPPTNTLTRQVCRELTAAAAEVGRRPDIIGVVLYGGHEIFCAGDDATELNSLSPAELGTAAAALRDAIEAVAAIPKPTVAAVTGYALGSGLTLALAADWRVAGDNVKTGATEILSGLIPGSAGMDRLVRAVGAARAKELVYSGRFVPAEEASTLGLLDDLVAPDGVFDAAVAWAQRFIDSPPAALAAAKAAIDAASARDRG